jgi:N-dimethylarginine dimethylaminohydrolase
MCPPEHFTVSYAINPWMTAGGPVDHARACQQWQALRDTYLALGHQVHTIHPSPGLPDMVFAANGATVIGGTVLGARFRHPERAPEGHAYLDWFRAHGHTDIHQPRRVNEGEGDIVFARGVILLGTGSGPSYPFGMILRRFSGYGSFAFGWSIRASTSWTRRWSCSMTTPRPTTPRRSTTPAGPC